jgi:hypothetical protein
VTAPPGRAVHVYCGPTITAAEVLGVIPAAITHPPVRHGDLLALEPCPGDTVVIIDGVFHHAAPVRHKEILELLARGVRVVGAASMGALRAAELEPYGMTGVGTVFRAYRSGLIAADDEVAVAHTPDNFQLSLALADIRAAAAAAATAGVIGHDQAAAIVNRARKLHYTSRVWPELQQAAAAEGDSGLEAAVRQLGRWTVANPGACAKHSDAVTALRLVAAGQLPAGPGPAWADGLWQNYHLHHWLARYRGELVDGIRVPYLATLRHQQLFDPGFPARWRRHVMSWVARALAPAPAAGADDTEARALAAAEATGLSPRHLDKSQLAYWLTASEVTGLGSAEQLARILVRSVPQDPRAASLWPASAADAPGLLDPAVGSDRVFAAAARLNAQVARSGPHRSIYSLRPGPIRRDLASRWKIEGAGEATLTAAGRDRGFHAIAGAVEAARPFFLWLQSNGARTGGSRPAPAEKDQ